MPDSEVAPCDPPSKKLKTAYFFLKVYVLPLLLKLMLLIGRPKLAKVFSVRFVTSPAADAQSRVSPAGGCGSGTEDGTNGRRSL